MMKKACVYKKMTFLKIEQRDGTSNAKCRVVSFFSDDWRNGLYNVPLFRLNFLAQLYK